MKRFNLGKNKYGAKKVVLDGITFDSQKEARRWSELKLLEKAGEITDLRRQVVIKLMGQHRPLYTRSGRQMRITVDFAYIEGGQQVYEDSKGVPTRDYEVRKAVAEAMGYSIRET